MSTTYAAAPRKASALAPLSSSEQTDTASRSRRSATKPLSPRQRGSQVTPQGDPDQLLRLFADNMRTIRKSRELSQEALADLCDLDRTYISGIERKRRNLSIRNIQRIAEALEVDPSALLAPIGTPAENA